MAVGTTVTQNALATIARVAARPADFLAHAISNRRKRPRVSLDPAYTTVTLRRLGQRLMPLEGHVVNLCENGMSVQLDETIAIGTPVTVEFSIAGLGATRSAAWPVIAAAGEVIRLDSDEAVDFPCGPYRMAIKFARLSTIAQAQIARFAIATRC